MGTMFSLSDMLGDVLKDNKDTFDKASRGESPQGAWSVDLPLNLEYRVTVDTAEYKTSKASGNPQIVLTFEVNEPAEYAGAKFQDYYSPKPNNEIGARKLAELFGALQAKLDGWGKDDFEGFVSQFAGRSACVTLRRWRTDNDRTGVRYINLDKGQELRTNVAQPKPKADTKNLRPEINIPKDEPVTPVTPPTATPPAATTVLPGAPAGVPNLPPGLAA